MIIIFIVLLLLVTIIIIIITTTTIASIIVITYLHSACDRWLIYKGSASQNVAEVRS